MSKRLLNLSLKEKQIFLNSFDYVFTDCDGVLWNHRSEPIEGVGQAISALKASGKRVVYVSNNSIRTLENYKNQLRKLGQEVDQGDVLHPAVSVINYLESINFQGLIYAICAEPFLAALRDAGYKVLHGPVEPQTQLLRFIYSKIDDKKPVKAVIMDFDYNCNYLKLVLAEMYLKTDPDCKLIAGATDYSISNSLGPGHYVDILQKATGRKAIVLGKPGYLLGEQLKERYGIKDAKRVLFVGDTVAQDVAFGKVAGFQTLLVLTGEARKLDVEKLSDGDHVPDYYTESFANFGQGIAEVVHTI